MEQKDKTVEIVLPKKEKRLNWLPSLVWLIPLIAALVGIFLAAKTIHNQGQVITITFETADGIDAGKTKVKYKNVDIGTVQNITLSEDSSHVNVEVQLAKDAGQFAAKDTRYWVVRPRIALTGVSGLGTLLSGAYIGADAGQEKETVNTFEGLENPPLVTRDLTGKQYTLHATELGSLDIGSPVYFRRVKVGQITAYNLDEDGRGITLRIFVNAPYDKFIGMDTRFWHSSGIDMQLNSSGLKIQTQSISSIMMGGVTFQTPDDRVDEPAKENSTFALVQDQTVAFKRPDGKAESILLFFDQSLRGLQPGATVEFRGVVLGTVKSIGIEYNQKTMAVRMPVMVEIYPSRLGFSVGEDGRHKATLDTVSVDQLVKRGLRAQLRTGSVITGQLYVALDYFPNAKPAQVSEIKNITVLPTIPGSFDEMQSQISAILDKLSKVPIDQIGKDLQQTVISLNATLSNAEVLTKKINNDIAPEMTAMMKDARQTLDNVNRSLSGDGPLQQDARETLQELTRTATSIRVLTDYLQQHPEALIRGKK